MDKKNITNPEQLPMIFRFEKGRLGVSMETLATLSGVTTNIGGFAQARKIWTTCKPESISMETRSLYLFGSFVRLLYGIKHRKKPIILTNSIGILSEMAVILGIRYCHAINNPNYNNATNSFQITNTSKVSGSKVSGSTIMDEHDLQIVLNRQDFDQTHYGNFMNLQVKGSEADRNLQNRTGKGRLKDSELFIEKYISSGDVIVDIGSGLGNSNPKEAGITVRELCNNPIIKERAALILASDLESEVEHFKNLHGAYQLHVKGIMGGFNTPIKRRLEDEELSNSRVFIRTANGIDLIMNNFETIEHLEFLATSLYENEVYYMFNKHILHKDKRSIIFKVIGELNNAGFDHKSSDGEDQVLQKNHTPYSLY